MTVYFYLNHDTIFFLLECIIPDMYEFILAVIFPNSNSNSTFIQTPGTEIGRHHGAAIRENELRRISLCIEIGFELLSKRGNSG